jgi:hypothetical protein
LLFVILASIARAQPLAASCYSPDRLGWSGPNIELGCLPCCGCRGAYQMQWQHRGEDAGWSGQPLSSVNGRYASGPFGTLTHLERYCMRMRFADDAGEGQWGPSNTAMCSDAGSDVCFTWDSVRPTAPVLLDGGVIAGSNRVELHFAPSTDDGGGVARYRFDYVPGAPPVGSFGSGVTSPISDIVGAGTWTVAVFAEDRALNVSVNSATLSVTAGFDASVAAPAAPAWATGITNDDYVELEWPDDGADSWVVTQRVADGGWNIGARPRVAGLSALLNVPGPCKRHFGRIARVLGDQVSDWSPASAELLVDTVAPVASPPTLVSFDGGTAELSWPAATDGCPSGLSYQLERSVNGAPFTVRTTTMSRQYEDPVTDTGQIVWRIVAVDGAGNEDESSDGASLLIEPRVDAGVDAGMDAPDAGELTDAGVPTPKPGTFGIGCGCQSGGSITLLLLALWLLRQRVGGFKIS